ncbi:MAG: hypothetical protein M1517_08840, partial [Deltaproteobacteria bacterium]|nr:hypothetical protein [Deltaproteobacteria bacterium]
YLTGQAGFTQGSYYAFAALPAGTPDDRDHIIIYALELAVDQLSGGTPASGAKLAAGFTASDPTTWAYIPAEDIDFDAVDSFASPANIILGSTSVQPTHFGTAPSQNRSTYMQVINLTSPIWGENVLAPGENGFIQFNPDGSGTVGPNFGDQVDLFRAFAYKPMNIK